VCGLSVSRLDHARRAALLAKEMQAILRQFNQRRGTDLGLQIGLSSGPVTAAIIGAKKFIYDLWGETVNTADRLHVEAARNTILVTQSVYARLSDVFEFAERGDVAPAGKSALPAWELKESPLAAGPVATEEG
jgi:class 3 adenylate cyclase